MVQLFGTSEDHFREHCDLIEMGTKVMDQYSLLHFSMGVVAYFWSMPLLILIVLHIVFEYVENTKWGMNIINTYFITWWPGGKPYPDNLINQTSDIVCSVIGWLVAYYLDDFYRIYKP